MGKNRINYVHNVCNYAVAIWNQLTYVEFIQYSPFIFKAVFLHDLHFMKTKYFQETFTSEAKMTSSEVPCFHKLNNTVLKMNGLY